MKSIIIRKLDKLEEYTDRWNVLHKKFGNSPFSSPSWIISWLKAYKKNYNDILFYISLNDSNELIGLVPLVVMDSKYGRIIRFAGHPLNDHNEVLTDDKYREDLVNDFVNKIMYLKSNWELFDLELIDESLANCMINAIKEFNTVDIKRTSDDAAPILKLPNCVDEYYSSIDKKNQKKFRYELNRISKMEGYKFYIDTDASKITSNIEEFDNMRLNRWKNANKIDDLPSDIIGKTFIQFLTNLIISSINLENIIVPCIELNSEVIAIGLYLNTGSKVMKYMQFWNYDYYRYSPGKVLDLRMIEYSIMNDFEEFDFGRGDEPYKFTLQACKNSMKNYLVWNKRPLSQLSSFFYTINLYIEHWKWKRSQKNIT